MTSYLCNRIICFQTSKQYPFMMIKGHFVLFKPFPTSFLFSHSVWSAAFSTLSLFFFLPWTSLLILLQMSQTNLQCVSLQGDECCLHLHNRRHWQNLHKLPIQRLHKSWDGQAKDGMEYSNWSKVKNLTTATITRRSLPFLGGGGVYRQE